jgi:dihydrofolate reductase
MPTGHAFMAMSLDGFVARRDHALDWLVKQRTEGEDHGYERFIAGVDGMVMGSGSFRTCLSFDTWPYEKPVVVLSKRLTNADIPGRLEGKVRVSDQDPEDIMAALGEAGWARVYVDGATIIQSFIRAKLISDVTVTIVPILIGDGIKMFGQVASDIDLELRGHTAFPSGLVSLEYKVL